MNIYEKLQTMRVKLQREPMKKSGRNTFAQYDHFELGDFLPRINELMLEHKVSSAIRYGKDEAALSLIDCEKPEDRLEFTSPMSDAKLKGCHDVQNLGAVQTYLRRYLYTTAFEIVEHDALDATQGAPDKPAPKQPETPASRAQAVAHPSGEEMATLYAVAYEAGYDREAVERHASQKFSVSAALVTIDQYRQMLTGYAACEKKGA